ncbi:MAG TPA: histidine kinase N-terminal 7TM domain-containing protein [Candidatus Limnocylindrales bacterium]|nr:histidine kinase N-terminal 7TM domain-containing protein [Candidatus Limnocylindrales bacterium]
MPEQLEIAAHGIAAILATWLGLTVLTRGRNQPGSREFGLLTALLATWSVAIIVQRLTDQPEVVVRPLRAIEDVAAYLGPAAMLHVALALAAEGRPTTNQRRLLIATYAVSAAVAVGAVFYPDQRLAVSAPHLELPGLPGEVIGWGWIVARALILGAALFWITRALTAAGADEARRRQLLAALGTVSVGALGTVLRFLPGPADTDPWLGVSLICLAVVLAAYAVFAQGLLLSPDAAARAFWSSIVVGLGVTLYVTVLIGLDHWTRELLGIDLPIVTGLALVVTLALFEPIAGWARRTIRGRSARTTPFDRVLQALGRNVLTAQRPDDVVVPALSRLSRAFGLLGAVVETPARDVIASHGHPVADSPLALRLPLRSGEDEHGSVVFGPKRSLLPFTLQETDLLSLAGGFLGASMRLAEQQDVQAEAQALLSAERIAVETRASVLNDALGQAKAREGLLQVFALGPLRVERAGASLRHWGGAKAGTRHAEGLFAFVFDRGERGAAKDEIIELIWPDIDLKRADLAFHRTLGGLRSTLEPGRRGGDRGEAITFHNDRYHLDPRIVEWTDVGAFEEEVVAAGAAGDADEVLRHLERARALYRGDYLDDCPFYGDSAQAEVRRGLLRGRFVDLLLALGERYELRGDRPAAAASFRHARSVFGDQLPAADEALARLGASG